MLKHKVLFTVAALVAATFIPLKADDNLKAMTEQHEQKKLDVVDGVKMYRPFESDGQMVISDYVDIANKSKADIFVSSLMYFVERFDMETEYIEAFDDTEGTFIINKVYKSVSDKNNLLAKKDDVEFNCKIAFKSSTYSIVFRAYDIVASYKDMGVMSKKADLAKLCSSDKEKLKSFSEKYIFMNSSLIKDLVEFIEKDNPQKVTHWSTIAANDVVQGMNPTEVKLSLGIPETVRTQGTKDTWMYSNDYVVIFTSGLVSRIIK